jgi:uncharacterized integral membrane protein (TIGR00698 family)
MSFARVAITVGILASLAGLLSPALALAAGMAVGVSLGNPWAAHTGRASRLLLQAAVVGLGFGLALDTVWAVGRIGIGLTLLVVAGTLFLGLGLGRLLDVPKNTSTLVAVGTAICGGSAIAAIAPILRADDEEVGSALATVFTLNAAGLFLFPRLGALLDLPQVDFGYWAALAIHDTSSVVAAGSVYGATALGVATTVKLTRAAWIAPLALVWAARSRSSTHTRLPWFIVGFLAAAVLRTVLPGLDAVWSGIAGAARHLLVLVLFLIGSGMTRALLRSVGLRPFLQGVLLWLVIASGALLLVLAISPSAS